MLNKVIIILAICLENEHFLVFDRIIIEWTPAFSFCNRKMILMWNGSSRIYPNSIRMPKGHNLITRGIFFSGNNLKFLICQMIISRYKIFTVLLIQNSASKFAFAFQPKFIDLHRNGDFLSISLLKRSYNKTVKGQNNVKNV